MDETILQKYGRLVASRVGIAGGLFFGMLFWPCLIFAQQPNSSEEETKVGAVAVALPPKEIDWRLYSLETRLESIESEIAALPPSNLLGKTIKEQWLNSWRGDQSEPSEDPLESDSVFPAERVQLHHLVEVLKQRWPEVQQIENDLRQQVEQLQLPQQTGVQWNWIGAQVRLNLGCQLAREQSYDSADLALRSMRTSAVVFPSQLLFYRGLVNYKLLRFAAARQDLELLLKHRRELDRRTVSLAELMMKDIPESDDVSLQQVARVMDDALRRQSLNQAGERVLRGEENVVALLDQLIERKEQQQQQQQKQSQAQSSPSKPAEQGMRAPLLGKGEIDPQQMTAKQWGDLPPEKQAKVIAEMTRQMPPHYKKVIEEYFRRLADESKK